MFSKWQKWKKIQNFRKVFYGPVSLRVLGFRFRIVQAALGKPYVILPLGLTVLCMFRLHIPECFKGGRTVAPTTSTVSCVLGCEKLKCRDIISDIKQQYQSKRSTRNHCTL